MTRNQVSLNGGDVSLHGPPRAGADRSIGILGL